MLLPLQPIIARAVTDCKKENLLKSTWESLFSLSIPNKTAIMESLFIHPFLQSFDDTIECGTISSLCYFMDKVKAKWNSVLGSSYLSSLDSWETQLIASHLPSLHQDVPSTLFSHFIDSFTRHRLGSHVHLHPSPFPPPQLPSLLPGGPAFPSV